MLERQSGKAASKIYELIINLDANVALVGYQVVLVFHPHVESDFNFLQALALE
jgi:hypothetical protein